MKSSRQLEIIRLLEQQRIVNAAELAERFDVSVETIRRDLEQLEKQSVLKKIYGGAEIVDGGAAPWPSLAARNSSFPEEKAAMAALAMNYIPNGCTIALDAGSTIAELCGLLSARSDFIAICSDIHSAGRLLAAGNSKVYMMGGFLTGDGTSSGAFSNEFFSSVSGIDVFACSTDGVSPEEGFTSNGAGINELKRRYIQKANKVIMLADHSKFSQKGFYKMCGFSDIDLLITDRLTPMETVEKIRAMGTEVLVAER